MLNSSWTGLHIVLSITLGAIGSLCYYKSLNGSFVFDDSEAVVNNKDIQVSTPVHNVFLNDFWGNKLTLNSSHKSYRPLTVLSFRLNVWLNEGNLVPSSFHFFNVILHGVSTALCLPLYRILFNSRDHLQGPAIATLLFAVHPVHSEAVAGIVGRADLLCAVLSFLAFLMYAKGAQSKSLMLSGATTLFSSFLAAMATLAKEQGVTILGICCAYDILIANEVHPLELRKHFRRLLRSRKAGAIVLRVLMLVIACGLILYTRWWVMGFRQPIFQKVDNPASFAEGTLTRTLNYNYIYALNFWLLLCPEWLCFDWSMGCIPLIDPGNGFNDYRILIVLVFWASVASVGWKVLTSQGQSARVSLMALAFLVIPFSVATNLLFRVGFVIAERVLYLPSVGYCMLVTLGIQRLLFSTKYKFLIYVSLAVLVTGNILRCSERSSDWSSELSLFTSGLRVCPLNAKVHYNMGKTSSNSSAAVEHYREALRLHPEYEQAMNNLANLLRDQGNTTEAEALLRKAVSIRPDFAAAWMNLGIVLSNMKRYDEALVSYRNALVHRKNYPDCYYNLGNLFLSQNKYPEAYSAWRHATTQKPTHSVAWNNMIVMLDSIGSLDEAKKMGLEGLTHLPLDASLHFNLANTLGKLGEYEEAEVHFMTAIRLKPRQAIYHTNLGVLYHRWKKYSPAIDQYKMALEINASLTNVQQNLKAVRKLLKLHA